MTETKRYDIMPHNIIDNANAFLQHINYKQKMIQATANHWETISYYLPWELKNDKKFYRF